MEDVEKYTVINNQMLNAYGSGHDIVPGGRPWLRQGVAATYGTVWQVGCLRFGEGTLTTMRKNDENAET